MGIFNLDGPVMRFFNGVADIFILSMVWLLFSIPLFTIGASTTALFYVVTRRLSNREGYLFRDFYESFKLNFKKATLLFLLWLFAVGLVVLNVFALYTMEFHPVMVNILVPIQIFVFIELCMVSVYLYPLTARFEMGFRQTIKTAFFMANRHIVTTFICIFTGVAIVLIAFTAFPPLIMAAVGLYSFSVSYFLMRVFKKYRPEIDEDEAIF